MEHFKSVLNQQTTFDEQVLSEIPPWPIASYLDEKPATDEILKATNQTPCVNYYDAMVFFSSHPVKYEPQDVSSVFYRFIRN